MTPPIFAADGVSKEQREKKILKVYTALTIHFIFVCLLLPLLPIFRGSELVRSGYKIFEFSTFYYGVHED